MRTLRTLAIALALVALVVAAQAILFVLVAWLTVVPVSFAGALPAGTPDLTPVVSFHVGPLVMAAGTVAARLAADVPLPLTALRGADVEVYEVDDDVDADSLLAPPGPDWFPVVRVRDEGDLVGVFARIDGKRLEGLQVVVFADDEDLVRVRLSGRLDRAAVALVAWGLEQARRDGQLREGAFPVPPTWSGP